MSEYSEREMRLIEERDTALTRAEKAEADVVEAKRMEKAAWDDWDAKREGYEQLQSEAKSSEDLYQRERGWREEAEKAKNGAYKERDACVAVMTRMARNLGWPCGLGKHDPDDTSWDKDWMNIVYIEVPVEGKLRQCSWHIHDSEMPLFEFLPPYEKKWDGHTTEEKYAVLARFCGGPRG
jgi:hypothetical protein